MMTWYEPTVNIRWDPTISHDNRRAVIRSYAQIYGNNKTFIETGTSFGETTIALVDCFDQLYTIEVGLDLFQRNAPIFEGYRTITPMLGDSTEVLPPLLRRVNVPCIFWLDGHFCGNHRGAKETPIQEELEIIFATKLPHVILIDDARLFGRNPAYPTLEWVRDIATTQDIHFKFAYADDIMRITPA